MGAALPPTYDLLFQNILASEDSVFCLPKNAPGKPLTAASEAVQSPSIEMWWPAHTSHTHHSYSFCLWMKTYIRLLAKSHQAGHLRSTITYQACSLRSLNLQIPFLSRVEGLTHGEFEIFQFDLERIGFRTNPDSSILPNTSTCLYKEQLKLDL